MSKEYDPEVIASSFIKQFYEKLSKNPLELHRFYKEESYFTHSDNQQQTSAISGIENIRKKVLELNLAGSKVDLSEGSLDAHRSEGNGVIMVATGLFTPADSIESSPFVQTFFLSSQKTASYFVRNSVFRIVGGPVKSNKKASDSNNSTEFSINSNNNIDQPETSHPTVDIDYNNQSFIPDTETSDQDIPLDNPTDPVAELVIEETNTYEDPGPEREPNEIEVTESTSQEIIAPLTSVPLTVNDTEKQVKTEVVVVNRQPEAIHVEVPAVNSKPKSFIEALKSKQAAAAAEVASKTKTATFTSSISPPPVPPSNHTIVPPTYISHLPPVTSNATSRTFKRSSDERVRHSVYVKNVTEKITESDIRALFSQFGDVMNVDIRGQKGFAFVEFETMDMVHRALEHKEALQVSDQLLFIQERTSSINSKSTTVSTPPSTSNNNSSRNHRRSRIPNDSNNNADNKDKPEQRTEQRPRNRHRNHDKNNDTNTNDINHNKHRSNNDNNKVNKESASNEENIKH